MSLCVFSAAAPGVRCCSVCGRSVRSDQPPDRIRRLCVSAMPADRLRALVARHCAAYPQEIAAAVLRRAERCAACAEFRGDRCSYETGCDARQKWLARLMCL